MKVLVTGISGMIGGQLSRELAENGFLVRALLDPALDPPALEGLGIERADGDLLDPESLQDSLNGVQAAFHCESSSVHWPPRSQQVIARNVAGTRNLLVAMAKTGVERLVHVGSAFSFGAGTPDDPGTEETPYDGDRFNLACLDSMKSAQEVVLRYNESGKVLSLVLNPTLVVGSTWGTTTPLSLIAEHLVSGGSHYPTGGINVVGAADVARAVLKALGRGRSGNCYIIGSENLSYKDLFEKMALALGVKPPTDPYGGLGFMMRGSINSLRGRIHGKAPSLTLELARLGTAFLYYSHEKAARELEFQPGPVDREIELFCQQYTSC